MPLDRNNVSHVISSSDGAFGIVGGRVSDLAGFGWCWSWVDLFGSRCLFFFVWVFTGLIVPIYDSLHRRWLLLLCAVPLYGSVSRRFPDCLLEQSLPGSSKGGAMKALVLVVVTRWSMDLDLIFIVFGVHCTVMSEDE